MPGMGDYYIAENFSQEPVVVAVQRFGGVTTEENVTKNFSKSMDSNELKLDQSGVILDSVEIIALQEVAKSIDEYRLEGQSLTKEQIRERRQKEKLEKALAKKPRIVQAKINDVSRPEVTVESLLPTGLAPIFDVYDDKRNLKHRGCSIIIVERKDKSLDDNAPKRRGGECKCDYFTIMDTKFREKPKKKKSAGADVEATVEGSKHYMFESIYRLPSNLQPDVSNLQKTNNFMYLLIPCVDEKTGITYTVQHLTHASADSIRSLAPRFITLDKSKLSFKGAVVELHRTADGYIADLSSESEAYVRELRKKETESIESGIAAVLSTVVDEEEVQIQAEETAGLEFVASKMCDIPDESRWRFLDSLIAEHEHRKVAPKAPVLCVEAVASSHGGWVPLAQEKLDVLGKQCKEIRVAATIGKIPCPHNIYCDNKKCNREHPPERTVESAKRLRREREETERGGRPERAEWCTLCYFSKCVSLDCKAVHHGQRCKCGFKVTAEQPCTTRSDKLTAVENDRRRNLRDSPCCDVCTRNAETKLRIMSSKCRTEIDRERIAVIDQHTAECKHLKHCERNTCVLAASCTPCGCDDGKHRHCELGIECIFVHRNQLCKHGVDVCSGHHCRYDEKFLSVKQKRDDVAKAKVAKTQAPSPQKHKTKDNKRTSDVPFAPRSAISAHPSRSSPFSTPVKSKPSGKAPCAPIKLKPLQKPKDDSESDEEEFNFDKI